MTKDGTAQRQLRLQEVLKEFEAAGVGLSALPGQSLADLLTALQQEDVKWPVTHPALIAAAKAKAGGGPVGGPIMPEVYDMDPPGADEIEEPDTLFCRVKSIAALRQGEPMADGKCYYRVYFHYFPNPHEHMDGSFCDVETRLIHKIGLKKLFRAKIPYSIKDNSFRWPI